MESEMHYCEETVNIWLNQLKKSNADIAEEIENVKIDISNELLWQRVSNTKEDIPFHAQNIANLSEYLARLEEMAKTEDAN